MLSKWCNLNSALGCHANPPSPSFCCFTPDSTCSHSALPWYCLRFLSLDSPQTRASPVMTCSDPAPPLDWPWALGCSVWLISCLGSHLSPHSGPMYFCSRFSPLGLLALALRPSPAWTALHPAADPDVPLVPSFPCQPLFCSRLQLIQLPSVWVGKDRLKALALSLKEEGKFASSVWFPRVGMSSLENGQL